MACGEQDAYQCHQGMRLRVGGGGVGDFVFGKLAFFHKKVFKSSV